MSTVFVGLPTWLVFVGFLNMKFSLLCQKLYVNFRNNFWHRCDTNKWFPGNETNRFKGPTALHPGLVILVTKLRLQKYLHSFVLPPFWKVHTYSIHYASSCDYVCMLCIYSEHSYLQCLTDGVILPTASVCTYFHVYGKWNWCDRKVREKVILLRDCTLNFQRAFIIIIQ